ncbi:MAG: 7-cyano-7-deazaguanine synthase QueC [Desulfobulbus sp.]|jgi:7-cyano-7-deazaguanine synthase|uniref:7-cyano-7-deazaguanine synthase QueC n=1 Tax=Desulfobulbus sp. TaxID=895 RepID=UPI00284F79CA|nr:7-cyano-7-deazaguanine synthase QueC [Desulfobulbus sp.]MDR2548645.1 7-cyano-7-deazaguanine synthase QueC [Desulfobulbus sp.]
MNAQQAVVLLSGGLDSTTVLAIARSQGFACNCLSFDYGQRQAVELERARTVARHFDAVRHLVLRVDLDAIGGSALTAAIEVPKDRPLADIEQSVPVTYVPGRNIIFLAHALSWAEVLGAPDIFLGINAIDYSGYPDCRPEFLDAFAQMAALGTKAGAAGTPFRFHAPLIRLSKKEIILKGTELGVDYSLTHSCYDPVGDRACGRCDACRLRLQGFREAGLADPVPYAAR